MGRKLRDYAPGAAFHITARMLGHWFDETVAPTAQQILLDGVASSDALLLAHAVMPNHFHLVLRSGIRPLGWIMQPIMRRLALLVNCARSRRGPVFEGRFRSHACDDADHLRRAIVYVHNNPLRKSLCVDVADYAWHSHLWYSGPYVSAAHYVGAAVGLRLFINHPETSVNLAQGYLDYFAWRAEKDRCDYLSIPCSLREPEARAGDAYFREHFATRGATGGATKPDLRDRAVTLLEQVESGQLLDALRKPYLSRRETRTRRELICALLQEGYPGGKVATLFRISDAVVSRCASQLRYARSAEKSNG